MNSACRLLGGGGFPRQQVKTGCSKSEERDVCGPQTPRTPFFSPRKKGNASAKKNSRHYIIPTTGAFVAARGALLDCKAISMLAEVFGRKRIKECRLVEAASFIMYSLVFIFWGRRSSYMQHTQTRSYSDSVGTYL